MIKKIILSALFISFNTFGQTEYVGTEQCIDCHKEQSDLWQNSHHERAMDHANEKSVLGTFNGDILKSKKRNAKFFKKDNEFWVEIEEHGEKPKEFKISYTFGYEPLQQYMVEFDDGRIQLIPFTWDSRKKEDGGQRWYDLYPETENNDEFYWLNSGQNWNFMCADCHSTDLKKGYNKEKNSYNTTWKEINVGCEACHGKGSEHVNLANKNNFTNHRNLGFDRDLSQAVDEWVYNEKNQTLMPKDINHTDQVTVCVQCHSRRLQISEDTDIIKGDIFDKYIVSNITSELYHPDGMIYDENYVYGSFKQSKMAEAGVTCTNCHDPHSTKLKIPKEQVCLQCHMPTKYSSEKHTFHKKGTLGDQCTSCHMPETTYMMVDNRADHSWHVPNPAESATSSSPNVCMSCHEDKDLRWADQKVKEWYPNSKRYDISTKNHAYVFGQDAKGDKTIDDELSHIAQNKNETDIIRASALERMVNHPTKNSYVALLRNAKNENSQIRYSVTAGVRNLPLEAQWKILEPMLTDKVLAVRTNAAAILSNNWKQLTEEQKNIINPALNEYIKIQEFNSDRAFGRNNLGNVYASKGLFDKAKKEYEGAIDIEPYYELTYMNLSALYTQHNLSKESKDILKKGIKELPESSQLYYSLGLAEIRDKNNEDAAKALEQAVLINGSVSNWYLYGLVLEKIDIQKSIIALTNAYNFSGQPNYLYTVCEVMLRNNHSDKDLCVKKLSTIIPPEVVNELKSKYK